MQANSSDQTLKGNEALLSGRSSGLSDPYLLAPLDLKRESIRLVKLLPSSDSANIRCDMRSFSLNNTCPPYIALSYKWDHEPSKDAIVLNGTEIPIGHNLWAFLERMRLRKIFETFWIDALSINQADTKERNHQVQIMKNIYSNARSVSIWLGESEQGSDLHKAMSVLKSCNGSAYRPRTLSSSDSESRFSRLKMICNHEYWRRIWIIQEVFHAKRATIYCGSSDADLSTLEQLVVDAHAQYPSDLTMNSLLATPAAKIVNMRSDGKPWSLLRLLIRFRRHEATEVKDRVYALHGICAEASQITVDYSISREELFAQVMRWIQLTSGDTIYRRMVAQMLELE